LNWEPAVPFGEGLRKTYAWIETQFTDRKAGRHTVSETY
jgi:hypothetical protein